MAKKTTRKARKTATASKKTTPVVKEEVVEVVETTDEKDFSSPSVGIVTADGVPMILNYNKKCGTIYFVFVYLHRKWRLDAV